MESNKSHSSFFTLLGTNDTHVPYRRGLLLSELNTPCFPIVCQMILPDPLTIECLSQIQKKLFLCVSYSSVIPCLPMLNKYENESKSDSNLRPFVDYEGAVTLFTFQNFFNDNSKIENNEFVFYVDSNKYTLNEQTSKEILNLMKPSMSVIPCELLKYSDRSKWSSKKRTRVNMLYELYYNTLLECSNVSHLINAKHPVLEFEGKDQLQGTDYSGFGYGESLKDRREKLTEMIMNTDKQNLRVLQLRTGTPLEVLHSVLLGFDVVVTPYPEVLSNQGKALYFHFPKEYQCDYDLEYVLNSLEEKCKFVDGVYKDDTNDYLDLKDSVYVNDINVLIHEESIRKESRGYLNHLLASNEMTATIILSSHNWWMYEKLFQMVKDSMDNNTLVGFVYNFMKLNAK